MKKVRLINADLLKQNILDSAKEKGTEKAMKVAEAFCEYIDEMPFVADEEEIMKQHISNIRKRLLKLDEEFNNNKISLEEYNDSKNLISREVTSLEQMVGIKELNITGKAWL